MGPNGTSGTFFTDPTGGEAIPAVLSDKTNDQWIQYKVWLETTNTTFTPTLLDVTLTYATVTPPTAITVIPDRATLNVTETQQFTATVLPAGANQSVTWSVTNITGTGTINATGFFRAISAGTVNVTATSVVDTNITRNATVTVIVPVVVPLVDDDPGVTPPPPRVEPPRVEPPTS